MCVRREGEVPAAGSDPGVAGFSFVEKMDGWGRDGEWRYIRSTFRPSRLLSLRGCRIERGELCLARRNVSFSSLFCLLIYSLLVSARKNS